MKFLLAPNAFKGTITADKAASIFREVICEKWPDAQVEVCPIADGGDGTCQLLGRQLNLPAYNYQALNPIGRSVSGSFYLNESQKTAYLDIATVSGIQWLKQYEIDAQVTSSYGTGELIRHAIELGSEKIVLGLGGSATVDMGTGILRALGFLFLDVKGREIPLFGRGFLSRIAHIQLPLKPLNVRFACLCDVRNYFFGKEGAVPVFGPQKGIKVQDLRSYEQDTKQVFHLLQSKSNSPLKDKAGFGAAGGIALGLSAFYPVEMEEGALFFFSQVGMETKVKEADWIITGEGRYDSQSAGGKGSYELLQLVRRHGKKALLVTSGKEGKSSGFDDMVQLKDLDFNSNDFKEQAEKNLYEGLKSYLEKM